MCATGSRVPGAIDSGTGTDQRKTKTKVLVRRFKTTMATNLLLKLTP